MIRVTMEFPSRRWTLDEILRRMEASAAVHHADKVTVEEVHEGEIVKDRSGRVQGRWFE